MWARMGSPPHTWRIHDGTYKPTKDDRITSTYVENTEKQKWNSSVTQDHLHIRGEYAEVLKVKADWLGSPPHTWRIQ